MSQPFVNINLQNKANQERLINESERANTTLQQSFNYSTFNKSFQQATTFDSGKCIPVLLQECYPTDIYDIDVNAIVRLSAPASTPLMNINWDLNFFFVPYEQIDPDFKYLLGENAEYGYQKTNLKFPKLFFDFKDGTNKDLDFLLKNFTFSYDENDLANYFNIPIHTILNSYDNRRDNFNINLYPFLAYGKVWNEWYRDQNLQGSIDISSCFNSTRSLHITNNNDNRLKSFYTSIIYGKGLAPASKFPNYFTTCLPYQQKGQPIRLSGFSFDNLKTVPTKFNFKPSPWPVLNGTSGPSFNMMFTTDNNGNVPARSRDLVTGPNGELFYGNVASGFNNQYLWTRLKTSPYTEELTTPQQPVVGDFVVPTINDLRLNIVSQHLLENFALCGSRYVEQLKSIWGIEIDPKTINRTELIGGVNDTLIFNNIQQTSQTSGSQQLGKIGSSLYNSVGCPHISYAAEQHGFIIGILTTRTAINNGGQGLPKLFTYDDMYDLFNPIFNGLGEQPILSQELFKHEHCFINNEDGLYKINFTNSDITDADYKTFGYNEPFFNTKYNIDNSNGFLSLRSKQSLFPYFLYGEKYNSTKYPNYANSQLGWFSSPKLTEDWMIYNPDIIANTLFDVSNDNTKEFYHQFIALFTFNINYQTKQPLFNSPRVYGI